MKKRIALIALLLVCALALSACGCKHETWNDADCVTPKTCAECGETEGAPLGHTWAAATCETAKTCTECGTVEGEALGHSWVDAVCDAPKTCTVCHLTEGEALGHNWTEATTEAPKTCTNCSLTEGERIITDARFTTAACAPLFGKWEGIADMPGDALGEELAPYIDTLKVKFTIEFHNDGNMDMGVLPVDEEQIRQVMLEYTVDLMYQELASMGLDQAGADAAMRDAYGMGVEEYVASEVDKMNFAELFSMFSVEYVYYVEDDLIYLGFGWDSALESDTYKLDGDTLYLPIQGDEEIAFTRVAE